MRSLWGFHVSGSIILFLYKAHNPAFVIGTVRSKPLTQSRLRKLTLDRLRSRVKLEHRSTVNDSKHIRGRSQKTHNTLNRCVRSRARIRELGCIQTGTQPMAALCGRVVPLGDSFAQRSFPPLPTPPPPLPPAPFGGFNPPQPSIPPPFPRQPPTPRPPRLPQTPATPRPPPLISRLPHSHRDSPLQAALQRAHLVMNPFRRLGVEGRVHSNMEGRVHPRIGKSHSGCVSEQRKMHIAQHPIDFMHPLPGQPQGVGQLPRRARAVRAKHPCQSARRPVPCERSQC